MGIDLGTRRIGLAISDAEDRLAFPSETLASRGATRDIEAVAAWARPRGVERAVVGLPIHMDGSRGPQALAAERFAEGLGQALGIPVETLDERWTTVEAERALRESGRPGRRRRQVIDAVAASILLRTYLERSPLR